MPDPPGLAPVVNEVERRRAAPPVNVCLHRRKVGGRQAVDKNLMMAYGWLLLAKAGGYTDASSHAEALEKSLSASKLKAARSWANEWKPKRSDDVSKP